MCVTNRLSEPTLGHNSDAVPAMKEEASALIAVLARAWPCWAVSGRLVGIAAAPRGPLGFVIVEVPAG